MLQPRSLSIRTDRFTGPLPLLRRVGRFLSTG